VTLWQSMLLGLLQGLTEFLPVSSSGHLVIVPALLHWPEAGLAMDAMLHLGTLLAVVVFFWGDLWRLLRAAIKSLRRGSLADPDARVAWGLVIATVPAVITGLLLEATFERLFGMPKAAAGFLLGTAFLLTVAEYVGTRVRPITSLSWLDALVIGLAQALAIAPGLSRSGATIAAAMLLGFRREDATRFSFLLSVPITLGSGLYQAIGLLNTAAGPIPWGSILAGMGAAFAAGYLAIASLLALVRRQSLRGFAFYCALLGVLVLTGVLG